MTRRALLTLAGLLLPAALAAQQPTPTPQQQANPLAASFQAFGTRYAGWLVAAFDSIPAGRYGYKPTPVQQSVGYVAQHLEDANYQLCERFGQTRHATTARDSLADTVKAQWPKDTLVARLRASITFCNDALARMTDAQLSEQIQVGPPGRQQTTVRGRALLAYVTDLVDHYSQMANYMRLMGMVPPSSQPRPRS